jgi:oxygen-independent coproporphyrinogen-3 oxidase
MDNDTRYSLPQQTAQIPGKPVHPSAVECLGPTTNAALSLYIHTPFCVHKCHYCDFYSFVDNRDQQVAFVDRLIDELGHLAHHAGPLRTIFVGGGTPSLLRAELWQRLLRELDQRFDLSLIRAARRELDASDGLNNTPEFTVECNPESASLELMHVFRAGGVNRVSIGAQSFIPKHLKTLERWHDPDNVARALEHARAAGIERQSIDLIYAIPGQTLDDWHADLTRALTLNTTHLSCYNLTYEANTPMHVRLKRGEFTPIDEETEASMFELTATLLAARGLERYEVSNYAKPGDESTHNLAYWRQYPWLAAGPSASGHALTRINTPTGEHDASHRWKNIGNLGTYLATTGYAPITDHELPDPARFQREKIMTALRLRSGLDVKLRLEQAEQVSPGSAERLQRKAREFVSDGLLTDDGHRWKLTDRGWLMADFVARKMMGCV